jgi:universal stress protein A
MKGYQTVVIALSLDEESDVALLKKMKTFLSRDKVLLFVHATEYMASYEAAFGINAGMGTEDLLRQEAKEYLSRVLMAQGFEDSSQTVLLGPPAASVVDYAREAGADLIVVGNKTHHGLRLLLGSTADGILHHAPCDVLGVHLP